MYFEMCVFPYELAESPCPKVATVTGFLGEEHFLVFFGAVEARLLELRAFFVCLQSKNGTCHVASLESLMFDI